MAQYRPYVSNAPATPRQTGKTAHRTHTNYAPGCGQCDTRMELRSASLIDQRRKATARTMSQAYAR